jgi:hypothetical protein
MDRDGETGFRHAGKLGLEDIVSKRSDTASCSGRSPDWLQMRNAEAPGVKRGGTMEHTENRDNLPEARITPACLGILRFTPVIGRREVS